MPCSSKLSAGSGPRILIVEDEMLLAMTLEDALAALGCTTVTASRVEKGLQLVATEALDGAMLDLNVAGELVYPIAQELSRHNIPFVFVTGNSTAAVRAEYRDRPVLQKPFSMEDLERAVVPAFATAGQRH